MFRQQLYAVDSFWHEIPSHVFLTEWDAVHLSNNIIRSIPAEVANLKPKLTELHVANNRLEEIPFEIGELSHLEELNLSGNSV